jgi:hypothetical protein
MIQPTKDEIRGWLADARRDLKQERQLRRSAEYKLDVAIRKLGSLVLEGKIEIPTERLGEIVLQIAMDDEIEAERIENQKLIATS